MLQKPAVKNGLLLVVAWAAIYLIVFMINPALHFTSYLVSGILFVIPIFFIVRAIKEEREINEGMISLGEGFVVGFLTFVIGSAFTNGIQAVHISVDQKFKTIGEQQILNASIEGMETAQKFIQRFRPDDFSDEEKEKALEEIRKNPPKITSSQFLLAFLISLFFGALIAIIAAAVLKKG